MKFRTLVQAPAVEPLLLADVKKHLRVDVSDEDSLIEGMISAARAQAEAFCNRGFINRTYDLKVQEFPNVREPLELQTAPLSSVTGVYYYDAAGVEQTWDASKYEAFYATDEFAQPGWVRPKPNIEWPSSYDNVEFAGRVRYVVGYGASAASVPAAVRQAMMMMIGDMYENRESKIVGTIATENQMVANLLFPYKVFVL